MRYYLDLISRYGIINTIKRFFGNILYIIVKPFYCFYLSYFTKIDFNKVVLSSDPSFSDNAKAIYDYLKGNMQYNNYQFIWLINFNDEISGDADWRTHFVKKRVLEHRGMPLKTLKEIYTSKYILFTHGSPVKEFGKKREGQIVVNLWHGCGYKDIQKTKNTWFEQNPCDVCLVPGNIFVDTKEKFWGCPKEIILPIGYPRYDYFNKNSKLINEFIENICSKEKKLIVWMPTFRRTRKNQYKEGHIERLFDLPILESEYQLEKLNTFCKENKTIICIKRHPSQVAYQCESGYYSNIKFISNDDFRKAGVDLYSFLGQTNALISDYSSVAIDYILLNKPMAFALDDYEEYKSARGFVFEEPLKYMPGHHLYTYDDMENFIIDVINDIDRYAEQRSLIKSEVHNPSSNYSERVWKTIQNLDLI